jgi:iron complex transport system ATP-binding protein
LTIPPPILELSDATVIKDGAAVLDGVSLTICSGEHTAIVGPNGAGKSTLVNLLTHEDRPLARGGGPGLSAAEDPGLSAVEGPGLSAVEGPGPSAVEGPGLSAVEGPGPSAVEGPGPSAVEGQAPIRLFGSDRWNVFDLRSRFGIVSADLHQRFVNGNSAGRITARDAVLSRFFTGHGFIFQADVTAAMHHAADAVLERMGVAHLARITLDRMSTGEARRVLIARALVTSPEALLLDEPTTGLDMVVRYQFLESIRDIARRGTTLILVTHRVEEIIPEIESIVLLKRGRVAAAGPKATTLTGANLSAVYGAPITLTEAGGYYGGAVAGPP